MIYKIKWILRKIILKAIIFLLLWLTSCNLNSIDTLPFEQIEFKLPDQSVFSEMDLELVKWIIEIHSAQINKTYFLDSKSCSVFVTTQKNLPVSVTATPVTSFFDNHTENVFFKCAGNIYPYGFTNSQAFIPLTWENGFPAYLMQQLYKSTSSSEQKNLYIQSFNWKKLCEKLEEKTVSSMNNGANSDAVFYNPWLCNIEKLLSSITNKKFSVTYLSNSNCKTIALEQLITPQKNITQSLISSYIPENKIIKSSSKITIETTTPNFFIYENFCLVIKESSSKNVLTAIVNLPIFIEDI